MVRKRYLSTEQHLAIHYLALPNYGGLNKQEIAEKVGVHRNTLQNWEKDELFQRELKREIVRQTQKRLPQMVESMVDAVINDKNAAMAKLVLQMNDMLVDKQEIVNRDEELDHDNEISRMKDEIARMRERRKQA
jgi:transcriptional regulator with XRE-family HTH domain